MAMVQYTDKKDNQKTRMRLLYKLVRIYTMEQSSSAISQNGRGNWQVASIYWDY